MALMIDSVTPAAIPKNTPVVAGYLDGPYGPADPYGSGWTAAAWKTFPGSQLVTITVDGMAGARVYDIESGDGTPAQGAAWALAEIKAGRRPTLYANASTWVAELDPALHAVGLARVSVVDGWVAQYNDEAVVPAGYVAHQYLQDQPGVGGSFIDYSVTDGVWPGPPAPDPTTQIPQEIIMGLPSGCTDNGAVRAQIRWWWACVRSDPMTVVDSNDFAFAFALSAANGGYGGDPDLLLAGIIDGADKAGTLRPQFAGAV